MSFIEIEVGLSRLVNQIDYIAIVTFTDQDIHKPAMDRIVKITIIQLNSIE